MKTSKGLTLVELMVAMAVFAILAAVALPSLATLQNAIRADAKIREIDALAKLARSYAISYGVRVTLCPIENSCCSDNWASGFSLFTDTGTTSCLDGTDRIIQTFPAIDPSDTLQFSRRSLRFLPEGLASGSNGTFKFCAGSPSGDHGKSLIISNAGRIRLGQEKVSCE